MSDRLAMMYDPLMMPLAPLGVRRWRIWATRAARGRTLEVGVGTGQNLPLYHVDHDAISVTAIDPNGASLSRAQQRRNGDEQFISLHQARAEELPFSGESFDSVVATLVFCTIGDPAGALAEVRRVLKTGGAFRLVEHVRVHNRPIAAVQDLVTPIWKEVAGGCHLNRDTLVAVEQAGFHVHGVRRFFGGLFIGIDAVK
jgi:ubiquinone/menaquinone biosynthesis C-methylase UbiE